MIGHFLAVYNLRYYCRSNLTSPVFALFQLRDSSMRILLYPGKKEYSGDNLVSSAILHATVLYKLQH